MALLATRSRVQFLARGERELVSLYFAHDCRLFAASQPARDRPKGISANERSKSCTIWRDESRPGSGGLENVNLERDWAGTGGRKWEKIIGSARSAINSRTAYVHRVGLNELPPSLPVNHALVG